MEACPEDGHDIAGDTQDQKKEKKSFMEGKIKMTHNLKDKGGKEVISGTDAGK